MKSADYCSEDCCNRKAFTKGLCKECYWKKYKKEVYNPRESFKKYPDKMCFMQDCPCIVFKNGACLEHQERDPLKAYYSV